MTSKYDHIGATNYLSNFCKDGTPLRGRIALLSFPNNISAKGIDSMIMIIEYAQIMAILLRSADKFYTAHVTNKVEIYNILSVFVKFFSPGNLLPLSKNGLETVNRVLEFCLAFYGLRILLFAYIIWLAWRRKTGSELLVRSWQWIFHLQTKVLLNFIVSLYSNIYEAGSKDLFGLNSSQNYSYMAWCVIMILLEFALSFTLTTQFSNVLPSKRFSASKSNFLELNVLVQKFANNMLRRMCRWDYAVAIWTYGPMNILFSLARIYHFFHKLPVYNYRALKLQLYLLTLTLSLSVACFANVALDSTKSNMNFVIITWVILSIFCIPLAIAVLEKKLWALAFEEGINTKRNPETLVHKIIFIKHLLTQDKLPTNVSSKAKIQHLLCTALTPNYSDLKCKATRNNIFTHYLGDLMTQFPKNNFLKLYSAYRYVRKNKLYGLSIKTLAEINSNYPTVVASKSILKHFIQTKTQFDYQHGDYLLNLYDYCKGVANLSKMKLKMAEQAKLQWALCHEITSGSPDLAKILRLGNKAHCLKQKIHKKFRKMSEQMPDYSIKPPLLYAYYNLFLGYSLEDHSKYKDLSSKRSQKYQKQFENYRLFQENLLQDDTFLVVVSGEKETAGRINYVSPNLVEMLGRNLTGSQASVTTPPFLRANTAFLVKTLREQSALAIQNTMRFQFFYHLKGYMVPFNFYLNINPSIYGGLSFIIICRRHDQSKEFILLNEEGGIECFTKGIGETLGLFSEDGLYLLDTKTPISKVCPELDKVNQAFNLLAPQENKKITPRQVAESHKPLNLEEAKEISEIYSEAGQGKNVTLTPITRGNKSSSLTYHCTMRTLMVGTKIGKVVTLERVHQEAVIPENNSVLKEEISDHLDKEEDFKEDVNSEWINFDRLKSEQQVITTTRNENNFNIQNTMSSARNLMTPRIPLMVERGTTEIIEKLLKEDDQTESNEIIPVDVPQKKLSEKYKPHWIRNSNQSKINKLYQQALDKLYFPFFYQIFTAALYTLFFIVFVMYLYMGINMHKGISDLQVSKQILRMAESRNFYLGTLDGSTRFLWTYATQPSEVTDFFQGTIVSFPVVLMVNQNTVKTLDTASNDLFKLTSSLDESQREILFEKDVRMFDSNSKEFINLTSFQATDRVVEASMKSNAFAQTDLQSALPSLKFVLRNVLNDMLVKNTQISQAFSDNLQDKKNYFEGWITVCFSTSLSFITLIIFGFLYVLYLQAKSESNNLYALTRLKPDSMNSLKQDFLVFYNLAIEGDHSKTLNPFSCDEANKKTQKNLPVQAKQPHQQFPVSRGLWPTYYFYFLKVGLLILIPMILFLVNFVLFKKYLDQLSTKASQIHFIDEMSSRLGIVSGSFLEVISENDTTIIYNRQASVSLSYQISIISEMIGSVSDILGSGASDDDNDLIQSILYGDACSYLKDLSYSFSLCKSLANYQEKASLINMLSNLESSMVQVFSKLNSDRTLEALLNLQMEAYNEISLYVFLVIQLENSLIADVLNTDFEQTVSKSQILNITLNSVTLVLLFTESLVLHFLVINRLKQKETRFKQILGLFPANVVLPNFILKSYIMKTSNQTFNSFHDNNA